MSCSIRVGMLCVLSMSMTASSANGDEPVVAEGAEVVKLSGGFVFTEGPVWDRKAGALYFSDIPNKTVHRWTEKDGITVHKVLEGSCNGLRFDAEGNMLVCQPTGRAVVRITPDGEESVFVDSYKGKKLNSPNDLWVDPQGGVYFTDPRYGNMDGLEQDGMHVYYIPPGKKEATRILDNLKKPNGITGTADGKRLYIADHGGDETYVYEIEDDGSLTHRRLAAASGSDGLALDDRGNLYITAQSVRIYSPEAKLIREIKLPESPANVTIGGKEGQTLFITARKSLYAVKINAHDGSDPFAQTAK